ncbi:MAG: hypothetical protein WCT03_03025 [Candidatus Obscuribacterales bacterium]|jgi:Tfp pilus assembly protein PilO
MTPFQRNVLAFGPLTLGATILCAMTYPAYLDSEREHTDLATKKTEYQEITLKMAERDRLDNLKRSLEGDINSLRNAVPKAPYLDLLVLDLERMASQSKVNILALEQPEKASGPNETNDLEELMKPSKTAGQSKILPQIKPFVQPTAVNGAKPVEAPNPLGLKQVTKRLFVTGEYQDLIAFVKHLETYQRVISLKDLSVATAANDSTASKNAAAERAQKLKLAKPVMSFLLNVYYLP